jgi:uncharacterized membrane protein (DUF2068 family)
MAGPHASKPRGSRGLLVLAIYMWIKGAILLAITLGVLGSINKDLEAIATDWVEALRIDPENHVIATGLSRLGMIEPHQLKQLSFVTGVFAVLFITQGIGLSLRQRWAEFLTLIATAIFIPVEIYEIWEKVTVIKLALLAINIAVFAFLLYLVRQNGGRAK